MQRGDEQAKSKLAPPYLTVGRYRIPLDILAFVFGLGLIFFNQPVGQFLQSNPSNVTTIGQIMVGIGALFFIFGRIKL